MTNGASTGLPRADLPGWRRRLRYRLALVVVWMLSHSILRLRLEGRERLVPGPAMYCFNHLGWADPLVMIAAFPARARLYFYGPKEETLRQGARNRLMWWVGIAIPFQPGKDDLLSSVKRVHSGGGSRTPSTTGAREAVPQRAKCADRTRRRRRSDPMGCRERRWSAPSISGPTVFEWLAGVDATLR